ARAVEVIDGDTLVLDDGRQVRLVGIQAPKLPLGRPDFQPWPLADKAKAVLERLALGKTVRLAFGGRRMDRHGRLLAHVYDAAGRWLQAEMLRQGLARVYSFADNRSLVPEMLALERRARAAGRGIWSHPYYRVLNAAETPKFIRGFQLVEGRVLEASIVKGRAYLNFGADWRTDFTVSVAPRHRRRFEAAGIDPREYAGRRVRVRGWLKSFNGPMIEATHPEQIEVIGE
ncbi:MAG: thermonuclease family protein, partial [Kiloniellales bacterium]